MAWRGALKTTEISPLAYTSNKFTFRWLAVKNHVCTRTSWFITRARIFTNRPVALIVAELCRNAASAIFYLISGRNHARIKCARSAVRVSCRISFCAITLSILWVLNMHANLRRNENLIFFRACTMTLPAIKSQKLHKHQKFGERLFICM